MEGKYPEAIREYDEAIRRDPTNAAYYNNRGTALSKLMDYGRALADIEKALALDPNNIQLHNNVSAVLLEEGKFAESVANSQQAIELARQVHAPFEDVAKVGVASECDVGVSPHRQRGAEARQLRRGAGGV